MINSYRDTYNNEYNDNCKVVSLWDLEDVIRAKKHFEVKVRD